MPLFETPTKKIGTRIAVTMALGVLIDRDIKLNEEAKSFLENALKDENKLLVEEAKNVSEKQAL